MEICLKDKDCKYLPCLFVYETSHLLLEWETLNFSKSGARWFISTCEHESLYENNEALSTEHRLIASILIQLSALLQVYSPRCEQPAPNIYRRPTALKYMTFYLRQELSHILLCLLTIRGNISTKLYIGLRSILNFPSLSDHCSRAFLKCHLTSCLCWEWKSLQIAMRCYVLVSRKSACCEEKANVSPPPPFKREDQSPLGQG